MEMMELREMMVGKEVGVVVVVVVGDDDDDDDKMELLMAFLTVLRLLRLGLQPDGRSKILQTVRAGNRPQHRRVRSKYTD
eukprot:758403-Hanusia_phi.AAC.8